MPAPEADWRLWLLAIVGTLGFIVSVFNAWRMHVNSKSDAQHRARSIRLEEFRTAVRDPIRMASKEFSPLFQRLQAIARTETPISELIEEIDTLNTQTIAAIGHIIDAVNNANHSRFADGEDWAFGVDEHEDAIAEAFNVALDPEEMEDARAAALKQAYEQMEKLRHLVNSRVDERLERYANESESVPAVARDA